MRKLLRINGDRALRSYMRMAMEQFKVARLKEVSPSKTNFEFRTFKALLNVAVK